MREYFYVVSGKYIAPAERVTSYFPGGYNVVVEKIPSRDFHLYGLVSNKTRKEMFDTVLKLIEVKYPKNPEETLVITHWSCEKNELK